MNIEKIESPHPDYANLRKHWGAGELLMGGTLAMREARDITIPQEQREEPHNYDARVERSTLFNAFKMTVENMSLKPFSEPSKFSGEWGSDYDFIQSNIDGAGTNLDQQLSKKVEHVLRYGKYISIVNMPSLAKEDGSKMSGVEQKQLGLNPYISLIHPNSLISWSFDDKGLEMAKILYTVQVMNDDYEVEEIERIDLWTRSEKRVFEKKKKDGPDDSEWFEVEKLSVKNEINHIPITIGEDINGKPPLEDLSWLNLSHFRKSSDKDNILHIANVPYQLFTGFDEDDIQAVVSVHSAYATSNENADIKWVEVSGAGIEQSMKDLQALEAKMTVMGVDLITEDKVIKTATQTNNESNDRSSSLQSICVSVENSFEKELEIIEMWTGKKPQKEGKLDIHKDFNILNRVDAELMMIKDAFDRSVISKETYLNELQRRKLMAKDFDVDEELSRIEDTAGDGL